MVQGTASMSNGSYSYVKYIKTKFHKKVQCTSNIIRHTQLIDSVSRVIGYLYHTERVKVVCNIFTCKKQNQHLAQSK